MKKVYIEHSSSPYIGMFKSMGFAITDDLDQADFVCFTGGADVSPSYYGASRHHTTHPDPYRDAKETRLFKVLEAEGVPMVGICRGAQFLNVMSGGQMYQNVSGHIGSHEITDIETGEVVYVSSTHHQMMLPSKEAQMVAYGAVNSTREWFEGEIYKKDVSSDNVEVVYYKHTKCLCFQPHPEFGGVEFEGMHTYFRSLLQRFLEV